MKTIRLLFGMMLVFFMALMPIVAKAHKGHTGKHRNNLYTPYWIPHHIARANMRHVYFPEFEIYFDRWNGTYVYLSGRQWVATTYAPYGLRGVNFARAYKVGLSINSSRPYVYHTRHRANYSRYYRNSGYSYSYGYGYQYGHKKGHHKGYKKNGKYPNDKWDNDRRSDDNRRDDRGDRNTGRRGGRRN